VRPSSIATRKFHAALRSATAALPLVGATSALSLVLSLAVSSAAAREWPGVLVIGGNAGLNLDEIRSAADSVSCDDLDSLCAERTCRAIAGAYWSRGWLDAEVRCERRLGTDTVSVWIAEGSPSRVASLEIMGAGPDELARLEGMFAGAVGSPLVEADLEAGIDEVLGYYDGRGYPLAGLEPEITRRGDGGMDLVLRVTPGPRARLGTVDLRGLRTTRPDVARRETGLAPGQPYDGPGVDQARLRLVALGVFEEVSEPVLAFDALDTTISVRFDVKEARASLVEGALAYSPSAHLTRLVGSLSVEMFNLGGTLRRARVVWVRRGDDRLAWSLYYREPRILGRPVAVEAELASDVVDSSYARRKLSVGAIYVGEPRLEVASGAFLGSTKDRSLAGAEGDFTEKGISFRLRYEGRDRPVNPESGAFFDLTHEVESLRYADSSSPDRTLSTVGARAQWIIGAGFKTRLAVGGLFAGVFSSSGAIPVSHLPRLGGANSLRGYPEDWFSVERAVAVSLEVRRILGTRSRVYAFLDAAALEGGAYSFGDLGEQPFGYGLGFMGEAGTGTFRFELALGRGDTWRDAKIHLALAEQF
jgi:outer membrane protein assembly factor BamA